MLISFFQKWKIEKQSLTLTPKTILRGKSDQQKGFQTKFFPDIIGNLHSLKKLNSLLCESWAGAMMSFVEFLVSTAKNRCSASHLPWCPPWAECLGILANPPTVSRKAHTRRNKYTSTKNRTFVPPPTLYLKFLVIIFSFFCIIFFYQTLQITYYIYLKKKNPLFFSYCSSLTHFCKFTPHTCHWKQWEKPKNKAKKPKINLEQNHISSLKSELSRGFFEEQRAPAHRIIRSASRDWHEATDRLCRCFCLVPICFQFRSRRMQTVYNKTLAKTRV